MIYDETSKVVRQQHLTASYSMLWLEAPQIAASARPGQFLHIRVPGIGDLALRRPFSICDAHEHQIQILYKHVGRGTNQMAQLAPGDSVPMIGALGNGFPLQPQGLPVLVAGGYGVAPLYFLAKRLQQTGIICIGGQTAADILLQEEFRALGWEVIVATEDGSLGTRGWVTVALDQRLQTVVAQQTPFELFACGPDGLLQGVGMRAQTHKMRGWLSLDKHMVCGVGACLACVQTLRRADGTTWTGRVCHDGPIFEAHEIVWSK